jgi:membrane protein DedA with SNARE-associated domain
VTSIIDLVVQWATHLIGAWGLPAVFFLMLLESACIPVPSEAIQPFAGFAVSEGQLTLLGITVAGVAGNLVGSWIAYAVGYYGRLELIERHGNKLHIKQSHLDWADRWFEKYGDPAIFFSRMLPIVRTFISLPAGVARVPFWRFTLLTIAGCIPWMLGLTLAGRAAAENWDDWQSRLHYVDYAVLALLIAGAVVWLVRRRRSGRAAADDALAG